VSAPPIRHAAEKDNRGCLVCSKPILFGSSRTLGESHTYAMAIHPVTGEWRWIHTVCGLNHHVVGRKRRALLVCANCAEPLTEHGKTSAYVVTVTPADDPTGTIAEPAAYFVGGYAWCRDGGLYVPGRGPTTERPASDGPPPDDADAIDVADVATDDDEPDPIDDERPDHTPPF
jgi:hypothetical protein